MKLNYEGKEIIVFWRHNMDEDEASNGATSCFVRVNGETIAAGIAICSKQDNFSRPEGRERSLKRAQRYLKEEGYDKSFKKAIWDKFYQLKLGPIRKKSKYAGIQQ